MHVGSREARFFVHREAYAMTATSTGPAVASVSSAPPTISPDELHRYLLKAHRLENRLKWKFIQGLLALDEGRLYLVLGCSSTLQYAAKHFGWERSRVYEALRVARSLRELPLTREAFTAGLAYSRVEEITRIATAQTEAEWVAWARTNSLRRLKLEVQDARAKGRRLPRKGSYGLPAVRMRLPFDFAPEEYELVARALAKVAAELTASLPAAEGTPAGEGGGPGGSIEPRAALLYMARRMLETDSATGGEGRIENPGSLYTILYHRCPDCRRDHLITEDGPVAVPAEVVERVEAGAAKVECGPENEAPGVPGEPQPAIDRPNPRSLLRRLFLRDGGQCSNPFCRRRRDLQGHHLDPRSAGGRTTLANETTLCPVCHALVELGYVEIAGDPRRGLTFRTRGDRIAAGLEVEGNEVLGVPVVVGATGVSGYANNTQGPPGSGPEAGGERSGYANNTQGPRGSGPEAGSERSGYANSSPEATAA
jgi:hypothetical protein